MVCRFSQLHRREVINVSDGCRLGYVGDLECKLPEGELTAVIVPGPSRFFGFFGKGEEYYIPWDAIRRIGSDVILVDRPIPLLPPHQAKGERRRHIF